MKLVRHLVALSLATLFLSGSVFGAELSLDDCIEMALKTRAAIIRAHGNETLAAAGKRSALGSFLPRLSATYSYSKSKETNIESEESVPTAFDDTVITFIDQTSGDSARDYIIEPVAFEKRTYELDDQDRTSKSLRFSANWPLVDLANIYNYAAARADHEAARLDVIASEQDLIYSVKLAYYQYLASEENLEVQQDAVKRSEEQLKLIRSRFELGSASKSDVLKQQVQFGEDRLSLLRAQNTVTNAQANLAFVIGVDPRENWEFSTDYRVREFSGTLDEAIGQGLDSRPSLLAANQRVGAARKSVGAAYTEYLPNLSFFGTYTFSDGTRGDTLTFGFSSQARSYGFQVNWNIFDGFSREQRLSVAKVQRNNAMAEAADERNLTISEIKSVYLNLEQVKQQKEVAQENVEAASEDMRITQEKYNLGAATILDLLVAQESLKQAQVRLIQADFDLNLGIAELEKAMGVM